MVNIARVLLAVVATAVAVAAPAAAGENEFVQKLRERYVYLSEAQLTSEGAKVCDAIAGGMTSADAAIMVRQDLGVAVAVAGNIVSAAVVDLDC